MASGQGGVTPSQAGGHSLQLQQQEEHVGRVWVLLPRGPPQLHRVEGRMGGYELLRAVEFVQEEPGAVRVDLHQVEENPVERGTAVRGMAAGAQGGNLLVFYQEATSWLFEKKLVKQQIT